MELEKVTTFRKKELEIRANSDRVVYKADLQRVGSLINESLITLAEFDKLKNWEKTKETVISRNLLVKRSSQTSQGILAAIQKRFLMNHEFLPKAEFLAKAVSKDISKTIKVQLLYPYVCLSDYLIYKLLLEVVAERIDQQSAVFTKADVLDFLKNEQKVHPELKNWSEYLKGRWTRGFLAFLRDFDIMEKAPSNRLLKPILRLESFTFFMLGLLEKKLNFSDVFRSEIWDLFFIKSSELENFLIDAQAKGLIYYSRAGDIIELKPKYQMERWLDECLG
jgi:hypothetical protein